MTEKPWLEEPNHLRWTSNAGLDCVVNRNDFGVWCGYVRVEPGHPFYQVDYQFGSVQNALNPHGGVTFAEANAPGEEPVPNEWWIGFDCGHAFDFMPALLEIAPSVARGATYRDLAYVQRECEEMAAQLAALGQQEASA